MSIPVKAALTSALMTLRLMEKEAENANLRHEYHGLVLLLEIVEMGCAPSESTQQQTFCKTFFHGDDRITILLKEDDTACAEIRAYAKPPNLGVCSVAMSYEHGDEGWRKAEAEFAKMDGERARWFVEPLIKAGLDLRAER